MILSVYILFYFILLLTAAAIVFLPVVIYLLLKQEKEVEDHNRKYPNEVNEKLSMYYEVYAN